jgi:hypothetical protein
MARTKGSKNRPKDNGGTPGAGHNGDKLTDDERRALTLHHKRLYEAADALVERAKADRTAVSDQAKADLGKSALGEIKDMIAMADHDKVKAKLERDMRLARWAGMPIGFQVDLFGARISNDDKIAAAGKAAGMAGETCQQPATLSVHDAQIWIENWHVGQGILASAFGKKKVDVTEKFTSADTSNPPFAAPHDEARHV